MTQPVEQILGQAVRLHHSGQTARAESLYREVLAGNPNHADALHFLGVLLWQTGRITDALAMFRKAAALAPQAAEIRANLVNLLGQTGEILRQSGQLPSAIEVFREAARFAPEDPAVATGLARSLEAHGELEEAFEIYSRASSTGGRAQDVLQNSLGNALKNLGRVDPAIAAFQNAVRINPSDPFHLSNLLVTLWYSPRYGAEEICREHQEWERRFGEPLRPSIRPHANGRDPNRRLKLGYVSSDFCQHVTMFSTLPLLRNHDHGGFEVFCYASVKKPDAVTDWFKPFADVWIDCADISDERLAERIRADGIDILVDWSMHTAGNRLPLFARKPAPVQATWIAYPCTTGLKTIDYRITDPYLDPPGQTDGLYTEKSIRLPDSFWCYGPVGEEPAVQALPALRNGFVTFGCLNNPCKLNDEVLRLWSGLLKRVVGSKIMLRVPKGVSRDWVRSRLDVESERILFIERQMHPEYLLLYREIDLMLDTVPYNGHMTSLDALWMGVPVITRVGQTVVGRAGLSQLMNLGLAELVAWDDLQFVDIAARLAGDLPRLAALRGSLREKMQKSPLMDGRRFARSVEAAYRQMWRDWCAGRP
jgi:protein O-GlcNAc transferase